ncbi:Hsp20/alpha crystallin family protein [Devosia sp.]|uniref:Hsp20/alpha crystallin family protein n=1 Tax=Devosia sp. TaxID=1871048 RepID=UPI002613207B|nr:Hsp20/alpha crystallin family protein [Devosia sp.]
MALQADVDRAFDEFWNFVSFPLSNQMSRNAIGRFFDDEAGRGFNIDVRDTGKEIDVVAELPGFSEDDIEVSVGPDSVTIRAQREEKRKERDGSAIVRERSFGMLERTIALPPGAEPDEATARFKNGVLTVAIPKSADAQSRQRKISVRHD